MLSVCLYVCPHTVLSSLAQAYECFQLANQLSAQPLFKLQRFSQDGQPVRLAYALLDVEGGLEVAETAHLVMLPATGSDQATVRQANGTLLNWLARRPAEQGLASLCSSAFLLAEAGQLDGCQATTHWALAGQFRQRYPQVQLRSQQLFCASGQRFSSAGAQAAVDLCLHLVELHGGPWLAEQVAGALVVERQRGSQSRLQPLLPSPRQDDPALLELLRWLQPRYAEPINLANMAARLHCSPRTLLRRFRHATGLTPLAYLQRLRILAAQQALRHPGTRLEDIASAVGYADRASFSRLFKHVCAETPAAYRRRLTAASRP